MLKGFEWDEAKAIANAQKHRVGFEESVDVFDDPMSITTDDPGHSGRERRFATIGHSGRGRLLIVCHCDREDRIRIISARLANRRERRYYESTGKV